MEKRRNTRSIPLYSREATRVLSQPELEILGGQTPLQLVHESSTTATRSQRSTAGEGERYCSTCRTSLQNREEQVEHYGSDWHRLNIKRLLKERTPLTEEEFDQLEQGDVSSISGSGSDSSDDDSNQASTRGSPLVQFTSPADPSTRHAVYRCILDQPTGAVVALSALSVPSVRVVLMRAGGHFAGAVFNGVEVLAHKTYHRYTVRAKRGSSQSARDSQQGHQPKSAGATLRRYNEGALAKEISDLMVSWAEHLGRAVKVFVRAPRHLTHCFTAGKNNPLQHGDPRICSIPFTTRRPTFKEVKSVMSRLACVYVTTAHTTDRPHPPGQDNHTHIPTAIEPISLHDRTSDNEEDEIKGGDQLELKVIVEEGNQLDEGKEEEIKEGMDDGVKSSQQRKRNRRKNKSSTPRAASDDGGELYECCVRGDVEEVRKLLESWQCLEEDDGERKEEGRALPGSLLHAAVTGGHVELVTALLECGVDPSVRDDGGRLPYQLAKDKPTRDAFRRFMALYPDRYDYQSAQIPSGLTEELEAAQREKRAAKKRAQKLAKREREKGKKEEEEVLRLQDKQQHQVAALSDREKRALAAEKRMAAQLPTSSSSITRHGECSWCQSSLCGLVPFERLQYTYCSMPCVRDHRTHLSTVTSK